MDLLSGKDHGLDFRALAAAIWGKVGFSLSVHSRLLRLSKEEPVPLRMEIEDDPSVKGTAQATASTLCTEMSHVEPFPEFDFQSLRPILTSLTLPRPRRFDEVTDP